MSMSVKFVYIILLFILFIQEVMISFVIFLNKNAWNIYSYLSANRVIFRNQAAHDSDRFFF